MLRPDSTQEAEAGLVERLQRGDAAAFEALFESHRRGLLAYAAARLGDRGLAEDIVQECFVEMARNARRLDPRKGVAAWLYRVARNRATDVWRRRQREALGEAPIEMGMRAEDANGGESPDVGLERKERAETLNRALGRLSAGERDVLQLRFHGGLTFQEIARVLRRPLGTVLWRAHRSLKRLSEDEGVRGERP